MCNYTNVPVSKHNSFPSATKAWQRIAWHAATYGGTMQQDFYNAMLAMPQAVAAIASMQAAGVQFTARNSFHWAVELCGSFEVSSKHYNPPAGAELPQAKVLRSAVESLYDL